MALIIYYSIFLLFCLSLVFATYNARVIFVYPIVISLWLSLSLGARVLPPLLLDCYWSPPAVYFPPLRFSLPYLLFLSLSSFPQRGHGGDAPKRLALSPSLVDSQLRPLTAPDVWRLCAHE